MEYNSKIIKSMQALQSYCESEDYKGWDPYDGLNSKVAKAVLPLKYSAFLRLCVIQGFKRSPMNLRKVAMVPKEYNPKGIGLFLQGYCNLYGIIEKQSSMSVAFGTREQILDKINYLSGLLLKMRSDEMFPSEYHGACWGYNFDWQARRLFLFPAYTPTVVATNFCATSLMSAYEITHNQEYLKVALSSADFVMNDLRRSDCAGGILFSYSKLSGNDTVINASLLGSRLLSYCYKYSGNDAYKELARKSITACCNVQQDNGAWVYGMLPVQNWVDSFHTGYNLDALIAYKECTGDVSFDENIERGFKYYVENFFDGGCVPKYYDRKKYPIDIHCSGQLPVTLSRLHKMSRYKDLVDRVLDWTINNMQDKKGYFYYQMKPGISSRIPYMRWSNAFMFYAMSYYLKECVE